MCITPRNTKPGVRPPKQTKAWKVLTIAGHKKQHLLSRHKPNLGGRWYRGRWKKAKGAQYLDPHTGQCAAGIYVYLTLKRAKAVREDATWSEGVAVVEVEVNPEDFLYRGLPHTEEAVIATYKRVKLIQKGRY